MRVSVRVPLAATLAVTAAALVGCSRVDSAPATDDAGADQGVGASSPLAPFATELASKQCDGLARCDPAAFAQLFPDRDRCVSREASLYLIGLFGVGSGMGTPSAAQACAAAIDVSTCATFYAQGEQPPWQCLRPGPGAEGDVCRSGPQCASLACDYSGDRCGRCSGPRDPTSCPDQYCPAGRCDATHACVPFGDVGDACTATSDCHRWLSCQNGTCAPRVAEGATCVPGAGQCQIEPVSLGCSSTTKTCQQTVPGGVGSPCGALADGRVVDCVYPGACVADSPSSLSGTCLATVEDGAACDGGVPCRAGAYCLADSCRLLNNAACLEAAP